MNIKSLYPHEQNNTAIDHQPALETNHNALNEALWVFPMSCTLKILGLSHYSIEEIAKRILNEQAVSFESHSIFAKWSKNNKYISVNIRVCFTSSLQVTNVYGSLKAHEGICYAL